LLVAGVFPPILGCFCEVSVFAPVPNLDDDNFIVRNGVAHPITGLTEWNEQVPELRLVDVLNVDSGGCKPPEHESGITISFAARYAASGL
jgi:hypothetical protein